jgi:hypothetical protein
MVPWIVTTEAAPTCRGLRRVGTAYFESMFTRQSEAADMNVTNPCAHTAATATTAPDIFTSTTQAVTSVALYSDGRRIAMFFYRCWSRFGGATGLCSCKGVPSSQDPQPRVTSNLVMQ